MTDQIGWLGLITRRSQVQILPPPYSGEHAVTALCLVSSVKVRERLEYDMTWRAVPSMPLRSAPRRVESGRERAGRRGGPRELPPDLGVVGRERARAKLNHLSAIVNHYDSQ